MPRDARFWRNVTLIAVAHVAVLIALVRWNGARRNANLQSIVWMSGANAELAAAPAPAPEAQPSPSNPNQEEAPAPPVLTPVKSDIQLPTPTASPTPKPSQTPAAVPRPSPKLAAKPTPKKIAVAKAPPKPSAKIAEKRSLGEASKKGSTAAGSADKNGSSSAGGNGQSSELAWYGHMLHDRFHSAWVQPTTVMASGAKMSTVVRIRIERDGRVSDFTIVKPSGNVVVDESVDAIAKRVTRVDPLPKGLGSSGRYEVKINFELNE